MHVSTLFISIICVKQYEIATCLLHVWDLHGNLTPILAGTVSG